MTFQKTSGLSSIIEVLSEGNGEDEEDEEGPAAGSYCKAHRLLYHASLGARAFQDLYRE
jgi:hypothetical protein